MGMNNNEQQLPSMPEASIPAPDFVPEHIDSLRAYVGLTAGIAAVAVASGLYAWKDKWQAAKNAVDNAEEERDSISTDTEEGRDKWWAADQKLQGKITDMYEVEDGPRDS